MRLHPGAVFIASLIAAALLQKAMPLSAPLPFGMRVGTAAALMAVSFAGVMWGMKTLNDNRTPSEPTQEPAAIVTTGPFRYTRNPMYISLLDISLGWACLTASAWFLGAAIAVFLLLHTFVIPREEAALRRKFPDAFAAWSAHTRRWL